MARAFILAITVVLVSGVLAACGSNDDDVAQDGSAGLNSDRSVDESYEQEPAVDADSASAIPSGDDRDQSAVSTSSGVNRMVIRDGELDLLVSDVSGAVRHSRTLAEDYGGHIATSSARALTDQQESAELTLEVPSDAFDDVMEDLRSSRFVTGVEHESTSSRDVTEEFVDLQARHRNLQSTEARFVELLDEATSIDEILRVENELSRIRGAIERLEGRINYLEQRTANSRIHVRFQQEQERVEIAGWEFTPGETAREAWNASLQFVGGVANAAIMVVVFLWWAWPMLIIGGVLLYRLTRRNRVSPTAA